MNNKLILTQLISTFSTYSFSNWGLLQLTSCFLYYIYLPVDAEPQGAHVKISKKKKELKQRFAQEKYVKF